MYTEFGTDTAGKTKYRPAFMDHFERKEQEDAAAAKSQQQTDTTQGNEIVHYWLKRTTERTTCCFTFLVSLPVCPSICQALCNFLERLTTCTIA